MKNVGSLISEILTWLTNMGYAGIAIGLMIEIIPSEIVLAYGGYMVSEGTIGFIGAIIAGLSGAPLPRSLFIGSDAMAAGRFWTNTGSTY